MGWISDLFAKGTTTWFQPPDPQQPRPPGFTLRLPLPFPGMTEIRVRISPGEIWNAIRPPFQEKETIAQRRLATLVGVVAFGLPAIMAIAATTWDSCFRDSISHFYYDPYMGAVFVGMLVFIGGFLIAYHGNHWLEDLGSFVAGAGACAVAFFPTSGAGCEDREVVLSRVFAEVKTGKVPALGAIESDSLFQISVNAGFWHSFGAGVLLVYLALYCFVVLRRTVPEWHIRNGTVIPTKRRRNILYGWCAIVIAACVAILVAQVYLFPAGLKDSWNKGNFTFVFETIALWAFGLAWIVKGRRIACLNDPPHPPPANRAAGPPPATPGPAPETAGP
ncbi:hypothetical protein [Cribrihabitans pelagius]|uniref:hypothetical protein n=1 Tax=Cribrihabitans pelagius TaxID=1765746 RepID=UPI003B5B2683